MVQKSQQLKSRQRRELKKGQRKKKLKRYKNIKKAELQRISKRFERQMMPQPQQGGFRIMIYSLWRDLMLFLGKIGCKVGIHAWKLCSGRPGDPKFACIRCWAKSKKAWGEDSREYYKRKENEPKEKT